MSAPREPLPRLAAGTVLHLAQTDWRHGRHPLHLRVEQVREDLSVYYDNQWVWVSGEQLTADGSSQGHLDALIRVAALPAGPDTGGPNADGPDTNGPDTNGRDTAGPRSAGPETVDSSAPATPPCHDDDHDPVREGGSDPARGGSPVIGSIECVVLDCPDVQALAEFYQGIVGGVVNQPDPRWSRDDDWATLHTPGGLVLCFQRVRNYRPPSWPDPARPQQFHLDFAVTDLEAAEREVLARGATVLDRDRPWRVYADPAGHPFCLIPHGIST